MEQQRGLEEDIGALLRERPGLTNQAIRKALHANGRHSGVTKYDINTTLHWMHSTGLLQYQHVGRDKCWNLMVSSPSPSSSSPCHTMTKELSVKKEVMDEEEYKETLKLIKERAAFWKTRNPNSVYPRRSDKIANFIENCALTGLTPELYKKLALDISQNGWD